MKHTSYRETKIKRSKKPQYRQNKQIIWMTVKKDIDEMNEYKGVDRQTATIIDHSGVPSIENRYNQKCMPMIQFRLAQRKSSH